MLPTQAETAASAVKSSPDINLCIADDGDDGFQIPRWKQWRPTTAAERGFRDICAARRETKLPASALKTVFLECERDTCLLCLCIGLWAAFFIFYLVFRYRARVFFVKF